MASGEVKLTIESCNVLNPYHGIKWAEQDALNEKGKRASKETLKASTQDGTWTDYSNWDRRVPSIARNIKFADIVCLQEISRATILRIVELSGYVLAQVSYHNDVKKFEDLPSSVDEYGNAVLYNASKVQQLDTSTTYYFPEARAAPCALFAFKGRTVAVSSVHLRGYWREEPDIDKKQAAKKAGYEELIAYCKGLDSTFDKQADSYVIAGDFNEDPREEKMPLYRLDALKERGYTTDGSITASRHVCGTRIDYIAHKSLDGKAVKLRAVDTSKFPVVSDHIPIVTVLEWSR